MPGSIEELLAFLLRHGYVVLLVCVLAEQIGLPVPAVPALLAMGALIGRGHFHFVPALLIATIAATAADWLWYRLGQARGHSVVRVLCRMSLEPDSCVRHSTDVLGRYGLQTLLPAKFIPGFSTLAPPMAGLSGHPVWRFLAWDAAGSLLWVGTYLGLGYFFRHQLAIVAAFGLRMGSWLVVIGGAALALFLGWKYVKRRQFLRASQTERITPEALLSLLDAGRDDFVLVDLRHPTEVDATGVTLPGARRVRPDELEKSPQLLALGQDIILYCS